jgi:hypothetical protein
MLRGFKMQNEQLVQKLEEKPKAEIKPMVTAVVEEKKESKPVGKNAPFTKAQGQGKERGAASPPKQDDDIEEDIVQDVEDIILQPNSARDVIGTSGGAASSSAVGVDQSIDTLNIGEFDYIEEVKITPRK